MNTFPYHAFGQDLTEDVVKVKVDERVPPLFMLPPMYNGYTSYTCPILEDEYEEVSDTEYPKKLSTSSLGSVSTRSPSGQAKSSSQPNPSSTESKTNLNTTKSKN